MNFVVEPMSVCASKDRICGKFISQVGKGMARKAPINLAHHAVLLVLTQAGESISNFCFKTSLLVLSGFLKIILRA